jgi:predicted ATP-grasp superfamily ATP-dependent carboligase
MITGVTGVLLNEGRWRNVDVIALLAEARVDMPDARAGVALVRVLDALLPELSIDLAPLQEQARNLEDHLQRLKQQARAVVKTEPIPAEMYR